MLLLILRHLHLCAHTTELSIAVTDTTIGQHSPPTKSLRRGAGTEKVHFAEGSNRDRMLYRGRAVLSPKTAQRLRNFTREQNDMKRILGRRKTKKSSEDGKDSRESRTSEEPLVCSPNDCVELREKEK